MQIQPYTPRAATLLLKYGAHMALHPGRLPAFRHRRTKHKTYSYQGPLNTGILFVHIPKCAGVSINYALYNSLGPGHQPTMRYLYAAGPGTFLSTYRFTVVRNPWDRLVSAYHFLKNGGFNDKDRQFFEAHLSHYPTFDNFVKDWLTPQTLRWIHHFRPQSDYLSLTRDGKTPLNDLYFFENLDQDLANSPNPTLSALEVPRKNHAPESSAHYLDHYSPESLRIVEDLYQRDIRLLGYTSDNASLPEQMRARDQRFRN